MKLVLGYFDSISEWCGKAVSWLIYILIAEMVYDTAARYIFNAPTIWSHDVTVIVYGTSFMLGAAYTLLHEGHIRVDLIFSRVSPKTRQTMELICYVFFFFPIMFIWLYYGWDYCWTAALRSEVSPEAVSGIPLYPYKFVIPVTALLLILQGAAKFGRALIFIVRRKELRVLN